MLNRYLPYAKKIQDLDMEVEEAFNETDKAILSNVHWQLLPQTWRVKATEDAITTAKQNVAASLTDIAKAKEALDGLRVTGKKVKKSTVVTSLTRVPFVKEKTVKLYEKETETGTHQYVTFNTNSVTCTIDSKRLVNSVRWLQTPHNDKPSIVIPGVKVDIRLTDGRLFIKPVTNRNVIGKLRFITSYNSNAAHPHCLAEHIPCLGDFNGPFREAVDDLDWKLMASIIKMFLSKAVYEDSAGSYFTAGYNYILARVLGISERSTLIMQDSSFRIPNDNRVGYVKFEEQETPGDYFITTRIGNDRKVHEYAPSKGGIADITSDQTVITELPEPFTSSHVDENEDEDEEDFDVEDYADEYNLDDIPY
jgi:hypothetical protein